MALLDLTSRIKITQLVAPHSTLSLAAAPVYDCGVFTIADDPEAENIDCGLFDTLDDPESLLYDGGEFINKVIGLAVNSAGYDSLLLVFGFDRSDNEAVRLSIEEADSVLGPWQPISTDRLNGFLAIDDFVCVVGLTDVNGLTKTFVRPVVFVTNIELGLVVDAVQSNSPTRQSVYI